MSQNSLLIPDGTGAAVLTEVRNALDTLVSLNAGSGAPTELVVGMLWSNGSYVYQLQSDGTTWLALWKVGASTELAHNMPGYSAYLSGTIATGFGSFTALDLSSVQWDDEGWHSVVNTTRLTVPVTGHYRVSGQVAFSTTSAGQFVWQIKKNGSAANEGCSIPMPAAATNYGQCVPISTTIPLTAGDYIELYVAHNVGSSVSLNSFSRFNMERVK